MCSHTRQVSRKVDKPLDHNCNFLHLSWACAIQEKNRLIKDIKQLKAHYEKYEPTIAALKRKYETATREKSLTGIERDRLAQALKALQASLAEQADHGGDTIKGEKHHSACIELLS